MNLHPLRADLAVMNILGEHQIAASESMTQTAMTLSWRRYGLREHDLPKALLRLQALGMVRLERERGQRVVVLTEAGASWLHSSKGLSARLLLIPRFIGKLLSGWRAPSRYAPLRRRHTDGPPPEP